MRQKMPQNTSPSIQPRKTITDHLAQYAAYHRNRRNIATHIIGIPMIVLGLLVLLSRPESLVGNTMISPANIVVILAVFFYIRLDIKLGLLMTLLLWIGLNVAAPLAAGTTTAWLGWGLGLFVVGWVFQFIGHYFEGKKPAFVDDIMGLAIGPLFVVSEVVFMLGLRKQLRADIEARFEQPAKPAAPQTNS